LKKKPADKGPVIPFQNLDKGLVLQEKRIFGEAKTNDRACCQLLTKILYLVAQGETFTKKEATDTFFSVTKLFQSKDVSWVERATASNGVSRFERAGAAL
jgi:coatomer protein complex subunit gamma